MKNKKQILLVLTLILISIMLISCSTGTPAEVATAESSQTVSPSLPSEGQEVSKEVPKEMPEEPAPSAIATDAPVSQEPAPNVPFIVVKNSQGEASFSLGANFEDSIHEYEKICNEPPTGDGDEGSDYEGYLGNQEDMYREVNLSFFDQRLVSIIVEGRDYDLASADQGFSSDIIIMGEFTKSTPLDTFVEKYGDPVEGIDGHDGRDTSYYDFKIIYQNTDFILRLKYNESKTQIYYVRLFVQTGDSIDDHPYAG